MITQKVLEVLATFSKVPLADLQAKFKTETGEDLDDETTATAFKEVLSSRLETFKDDTTKEVKRRTLTALAFNRTILELKLHYVLLRVSLFNLLTAPFWN